MHNLIATTFEVVHYIALQAVHYKPLQEVHLSRYNHFRKALNGKVDFANLDLSRCEEIEVDKGRLFGLKAYSKSLKRFIKVVIWYPNEEDTTKWQIYVSTDDSISAKDVIDCYRTRFQLEFYSVQRCETLCRS